MRSFFVMGVGSIGAVAMFAACSSPQPGAPGAGGDVVAACGTYFDSLGKREAACAAQEGIPLAPGSDFAPDSRAAFVEQCRLTLGGAGTGITPAYLTRCAAAIDKLPAGCLPNDPERGIAECLLPPGTAAVGAPCSDNEQCASGYCGKEGPDGGPAASRRFCGYCVATPGEGAPCAESGRVCGHGLACLGGTCRKEPAPVGAGGTCATRQGDDFPCQWGLECLQVAGSGDVTGVCGVLPGVGASCTDRCAKPLQCRSGTCVAPAEEGGDCPLSGECRRDLFCEAASKKCRAFSVVGAGAACGAPGVKCEGTLACVRSGTGTGTCTPRVAVGSGCTEGGPPCTHLARCVEGTCRYDDPSACK